MTGAPPPGLRLNGTLRFGAQVLFRDLAMTVRPGEWTDRQTDGRVGDKQTNKRTDR